MSILAPIVILVRPQLGENIGAVARAMSNFGLSELRVVNPRDGWPNMRAVETASGSGYIIEKAEVFDELKDAVRDINLAYGTTARSRDIEKPVVTPPNAATQLHAAKGKVAFLFGPERTGLENSEIALCDTLITIPTAPEKASLNLAQSAIVVFYEYFKQQGVSVSRELPDIAPKEDWQGLFDQVEHYLDEADYFRVTEKKTVMWQNMMNMLLRGKWNAQEIRTLRGALRAIYEARVERAERKKAK